MSFTKTKNQLAALVTALAVVFASHLPSQAQTPADITIQLSPSVGMSLGLIDPPPQDGSPAAMTDKLPFGNYVSQSTSRSVFARSYLYFPLPTLPPDVVIESATLEIYLDAWPFAGQAAIGAYNVTGAWDETMTWATRAALDPTPANVTTVSSTAGWYAWDVTTLVYSWQNTANNGLVLAAAPPQDSGDITPPGWAGRGIGRTGIDPSLAPRLTLRVISALPQITRTPTLTPIIMCTPPPCGPGEVYYCPSVCPGGCGTTCATVTPSPQPRKPQKQPEPAATPVPTAALEPMPTPMLLPVTGGNNPWFVIGVIMAVVLFALSALLWRVAKKAI